MPFFIDRECPVLCWIAKFVTPKLRIVREPSKNTTVLCYH